MRAKFNSFNQAVRHAFGVVTCAVVVLLMAATAPAQNLFESDSLSGNIYEFTPGGMRTNIASMGWLLILRAIYLYRILATAVTTGTSPKSHLEEQKTFLP